MRVCKCAVIRLSDVFVNWAVRPMTDVCMKMCSEPIVLLSAHLYAHVNHSGHCTFSCTSCVLVNVQWTDCLMCSCNWAVGTMTNVCMKMCSEPIVWLSAHLHAHVRHTGRCTFTWTWCVHINVHWFDCPMCSCKWGVSRVTEMCMKCGVSQAYDSMHISMHSGHCTFTCTWCVHVIGQWSQWPMLHENVHLVNCLTQCTFTCTNQTLLTLHIYIHLMCACKRALIRLSNVFM